MHKSPYAHALPTVALSVITSTLVLTDSAYAATFSAVSSVFEFSNFSKSSISTETDANVNSITLAFGGGSAIAEAVAVAIFDIPNDRVGNEISSVAAGTGFSYLALAESEALLAGVFELGTKETLSFDFKGTLTLATAITSVNAESAFALGSLGFALFGETASQPVALLDNLGLLATLSTPGDDDIYELVIVGNPGSFTFNNFERQTGGTSEFLSLDFSGRYSRTFEEPTLVSLVETKTGIAEVQAVPAPSLIWGILTYSGLGMVSKLRKQSA